MTALGRWAHHAMLEPRKYLGWPAAIIGRLILAVVVVEFDDRAASTSESELWSKLETAKKAAERVDMAKANPESPAVDLGPVAGGQEYFSQALADLPNNRDVALPTSKKALDLFDQVIREAPHDSPQARAAALGKARVLEMRNELSKAIEQYELVAKDWPDTPEAEEAKRYAEALKDPQAAAFYKELYAYSPTKMTLPPFGTESLPLPSSLLGPAPGPGSNAGAAPAAPSASPPPLSPGLRGIPGVREVVEARMPADQSQAAQPKPRRTRRPSPRPRSRPAPRKSCRRTSSRRSPRTSK